MSRSRFFTLILASLLVLVVFNLVQHDRFQVPDSTYSRWLSEFRNGQPTHAVSVVVEFVDPYSGEVSEKVEISSEATGWEKLLRLLEIIESGNLLARPQVDRPVLDIVVASASVSFRGQVDMQTFSEQVEPGLFLALVRESRRGLQTESAP